MTRRAAALFTALALTAAACSGSGSRSTTPTTNEARVSEDRAVTIARRAWAAVEPAFDFSTRDPEVAVRGSSYDVAFVDRDLAGNQGEPHVIIDRTTGRVRDTYRTR